MQKENVPIVLAVLVASLFVLLLVIALLTLFRIFLKRKNALLYDKQMMMIEFEQTKLRSKLEIQEEAFSKVSREIHDNIGQVLSIIRINLHTLNGEDHNEKILLLDELMEKVISDLRSLSRTLSADYIREEGWIKAVGRLFQDIQKTGRFKTNLTIEEGLPELDQEKPTILFRMIQEIINNILKHAFATKISLQAYRENKSYIRILISDNGKGFDTTNTTVGIGLTNLRHRSKLINASIDIDSQPGKGTNITIHINTNPDD
jgi:signal transduction histidine kinase